MFLSLALLVPLFGLVCASGCADGSNPWSNATYDVLVVGGGPAGLQCASSLGRMGRKVLVVDSNQYRNNATLEMHDVPALDNTPPATFRATARHLISEYTTVSFADNTTLTSFTNHANSTYFEATDSNGKNYTARKVILATGVWDDIPHIPGMLDVWGKAAYWCEYCDGFEHRGGVLAIYGIEHMDDALQLHKINQNITIQLDNEPINMTYIQNDPSDYTGILEAFKAFGGQFESRAIANFSFANPANISTSDIRITYTDGNHTDYRGLLVPTHNWLKSESMVKTLNLSQIDSTMNNITDWGQTSVYGVFAAGDLASTGRNVVNAFRQGKKASLKTVADLAREDALLGAGYDWRNSGQQCSSSSKKRVRAL